MGSLLHHSVTEAAHSSPEHEAFRFEGEAISYAKLAERASRLAGLLREQGVRPRDRVGIFMRRSLELPVAIYGILEAGAAYVPIDPASPVERIRFVLEDCEVGHLVTEPSLRQRVGRLVGQEQPLRHVIGIELEEVETPHSYSWAEIDRSPLPASPVEVAATDLAYIMYTSGSTGAPKGLIHTHASGLAYARLSAREYGVQPEDRMGNHSPLHFDMSTFEYLTGPLCGATSVLIPEEATMFPMSLGELIERERLTTWYSVPLALIQLVDSEALVGRDLSALRWVLFGGEPLPPKYLRRLAELIPGARFSNSYGPAEVNQCTAYHLPPGRFDEQGPIPLGRVWSGAEGMVVDDDDRPVASGEAGQLLINAPTMMQGYWSRPDLDRKAFFRQSLVPGEEKVFYRTGDLVREREDGNLLFLGRKDRQVKVRGYRVELDEVEAAIGSLPGVSEAAVVVLQGEEGQRVLAAAVLPTRPGVTDADELRRGVARHLPAYAVPSKIEVRESLPRTGTEKIDRRRLQETWPRQR